MGMKQWQRNILRHSPMIVKKNLANLEAARRMKTRRGGDYLRNYQAIDIERILKDDCSQDKLAKLNDLLAACREYIPHYRDLLPDQPLKSLDEIASLPLLCKEDLRTHLKDFINEDPREGFWHGTTGGTQGSLAFYRDLKSLHYEYALYDKLYEYAAGGRANPKKARFSNVPIAKVGVRKPPFTMEVSRMNQLQCSIYHLDDRTYSTYLEEMAAYGAEIGTGYAFLWRRLAEEALKADDFSLKLKGLVTDSEGMTDEERAMVEKAFGCTLYQTYGTSELGMIAVQCGEGHYHILDRVHLEIVDDDGRVVAEGTEGEIVVTDLWSTDAPFLRYRPGDRGIYRSGGCACGWKTPYLEKLTGRVRDYIVTGNGFKVNHVARIMGGIPGIRAFQYVQDRPGQLHIRVEIREGFEPEKMEKTKANARQMVGEMEITWEVVEEIEKAPSGKIKTMIRNFD